MPTNITRARDELLQDARRRGCILTENKLWWRIDGRHSSKWFNVAKSGTKVTLTGFCIDKPGVMSFSAEDAHDLKIGRVGGMFDFMSPNAAEVLAAVWKEIRADVRD